MCAFHWLYFWCCIIRIVVCREKMTKKRTADKVEDFAFDDDTSDSDEEGLGDFQAKVGLLKQDTRSKRSLPLETGACDSESDVGEEDSDSSSEESEEEVVTKSDFKLSEEQKLKLSKLKSQLADIGGDSTSGSESDDEDDQNVPIAANEEGSPDKEKEAQEGGESSEEDSDELGNEDEEDSEDDDNQENDKPETNTQGSGGKTEENSQSSPAKKMKLDPDTSTTTGESKEEKARKKYRDQLSKMSIEDIQKLKERLGLKLFKQKLEGTAPERGKKVFDWSSIFSGSSG